MPQKLATFLLLQKQRCAELHHQLAQLLGGVFLRGSSGRDIEIGLYWDPSGEGLHWVDTLPALGVLQAGPADRIEFKILDACSEAGGVHRRWRAALQCRPHWRRRLGWRQGRASADENVVPCGVPSSGATPGRQRQGPMCRCADVCGQAAERWAPRFEAKFGSGDNGQ